jgi:PHP family Zn ribbon phosphoesterase
MTQVLSVSATTAGYVSDVAKPPMRIARTTEVEVAINELARKAVSSEDERLKAILNVVRPPALQIYFLTASQRGQPQSSLTEAKAAYLQQQQVIEQKPATK